MDFTFSDNSTKETVQKIQKNTNKTKEITADLLCIMSLYNLVNAAKQRTKTEENTTAPDITLDFGNLSSIAPESADSVNKANSGIERKKGSIASVLRYLLLLQIPVLFLYIKNQIDNIVVVN